MLLLEDIFGRLSFWVYLILSVDNIVRSILHVTVIAHICQRNQTGRRQRPSVASRHHNVVSATEQRLQIFSGAVESSKDLFCVENLGLDFTVDAKQLLSDKRAFPFQKGGSACCYTLRRPVYHGEVTLWQTLEVGVVEGLIVFEQLEKQKHCKDVELSIADLLHAEDMLVLKKDRF